MITLQWHDLLHHYLIGSCNNQEKGKLEKLRMCLPQDTEDTDQEFDQLGKLI